MAVCNGSLMNPRVLLDDDSPIVKAKIKMQK